MNNIDGPYNPSLGYRIVNFDQNSGQIEIECEGYNQRISIDLPIDNGKYPENEDLDIYIKGFVPSWLIERGGLIKKGVTNSDYIKSLINNTKQNQKDYEKRNFSIGGVYDKRNYLLRETDWTQLPDSQLTDTQKKLYAEYRQQLRDITQQTLDENIVWPIPPNILGVVTFGN